jgi:hypothetical protein
MDIAATTAFMRERLFAEDTAEDIDIDGVIVSGHKEEEDVDGEQMGVFAGKVTLVIPTEAVDLPVPGQQMLVDNQRVTVVMAARDAVAMTIKTLRHAA